MEILKLLDANLVVAQIICFFLVLGLLKRFLWKPVFSVLEARRARVHQDMQSIEAGKMEIARLKGEYEDFLAKVDQLTRKRIQEAEDQGEVKAGEIRDKARLEAEKIVEDAKREIRFEFAKSRDLLKADIVEMVIKVTERMIQEKLTSDGDRKIIDGIMAEMESPDER